MSFNNMFEKTSKLRNYSKKQLYLLIMSLLIAGLMINFTSCCSYSFTGSSVPAHLKNIAIPFVQDRSGAGIPGLKEMLTQELINQFIDDNSLQVTDRTQADALLECTIVSFTDAPSLVGAGENIEQRRVTITVQVIYKDLVKKVNIFDKKFSNYGEYKPGSADSNRDQASEKALVNISEDILLAVVSGW